MTTQPKFSLAQQIEAVRFAETRQRALAGGSTVRAQRPKSAEEFDVGRLGAAARTLNWLKANEEDIRKLLAMPAERRALLWDNMGTVAELLDGVQSRTAPEAPHV